MKTIYRNAFSLAALTALFDLAGTQAQAQLNISYSSGDLPTFTAASNTLTVTGYTGTGTLISGVPQSLKIASGSFFASAGVHPGGSGQGVSQALTINGIAGSLAQEEGVGSTPPYGSPPFGQAATNSGFVSLPPGVVTNPETYIFGDGSVVTVLTDDSTNPDIYAATPFTQNFDIKATFLYTAAPASVTPEPGSVALLMGMTTVGAGVLRRKRRK